MGVPIQLSVIFLGAPLLKLAKSSTKSLKKFFTFKKRYSVTNMGLIAANKISMGWGRCSWFNT